MRVKVDERYLYPANGLFDSVIGPGILEPF
jgi:hypothetical protein